jgi:hypothetical protein
LYLGTVYMEKNKTTKIVLGILVIFVLGILFWAYSKPKEDISTDATPPVVKEPDSHFEERLEIKIGEEKSALGVKIVPRKILEDSRCPADVMCIQAGTVRLEAMLSSGLGEALQVFKLNQPITTEAEEITLVDVQPHKDSKTISDPSDYRFVFEIKKRSL